MPSSTQQLRRYRTIFLWLLAASAVALVLFWLVPALVDTGGRFPRSRRPPARGFDLEQLARIISIATAIASLLGFFITHALALQKERREREHDDLAAELKRLEIEKLRREMERDSRPPKQRR